MYHINKWKGDLQVQNSIVDFLWNHQRTQTSMINNKLQSFTYNFLVRHIHYNARLYNINIADTPLCKEYEVKEDILTSTGTVLKAADYGRD